MRIKIVIIGLILCLAEASAQTDLCKGSWAKSDQENNMTEHLNSYCELESEDKSFKLQLVIYRHKCERIEGQDPGDCFFARECSGKATDVMMSPAIYNKPDFIKGLCERDENFELLEQQSGARSGVRAYINCQDKQVGKITLEYKNQKKECQFPFSRPKK